MIVGDQQYNVGEKPAVTLNTCINYHAGTPKQRRKHTMNLHKPKNNSIISFWVKLCDRAQVLVNQSLIFSYLADHVPDWQPRTHGVLLGMAEDRSVNLKNT